MKQLLAIAVLTTALFIQPSFGQKNNKFGHVNFEEVLTLMPERTKAATKMDSLTKEAEKHLQEMMAEYEGVSKQAPAAGASQLVIQDYQEKMNSLQQRIQRFQQEAQKSLEEEQAKLIEPIINKLKKAVEQVAKENAYTYVFDTSVGTLLYWEESDNILPMVKKKLGLTTP